MTMTNNSNLELPFGEPSPVLEIVISLRDKAYDRIKSGTKTFEFRKRWSLGPCVAYIYRSGNRKELSAYMTLGAPIHGSPQEIARIAEEMSEGNGVTVEEYLIPTNGGYAIPIEDFKEFPPLSLNELREIGFHAPQQFFYLSNNPALKQKLKEQIRY